MSKPLTTRKWFRDQDGTYFRNCPLIMSEQRELLDRMQRISPFRVWQIRKLDQALGELQREWQTAWLSIIRKDKLDAGDVVVPMGKFRDVYPDKPGLWFLDGDHEPGWDDAARWSPIP